MSNARTNSFGASFSAFELMFIVRPRRPYMKLAVQKKSPNSPDDGPELFHDVIWTQVKIVIKANRESWL